VPQVRPKIPGPKMAGEPYRSSLAFPATARRSVAADLILARRSDRCHRRMGRTQFEPTGEQTDDTVNEYRLDLRMFLLPRRKLRSEPSPAHFAQLADLAFPGRRPSPGPANGHFPGAGNEPRGGRPSVSKLNSYTTRIHKFEYNERFRTRSRSWWRKGEQCLQKTQLGGVRF
jgi:hypothetical protein